ncbi:MAG: DUF3570 domain-containing protein [Gammaproteobacteria bacterium]|jgi:hypothetical protein
MSSTKSIVGLLSAATCSLLGGVNPAEARDDWNIDSAILFYRETDRVTAVEPAISATRDLGDDEIVSLKLVFDSLSGSSPNGAVPSTKPQTFTTPSGGGGEDEDEGGDEGGGGSYTVAPNEIPLDPTFKDERLSFSLNWDKPVDRNNRRSLGLSVSSETDFLSLSGNLGWRHELNQKNTTLSTALNIEIDQIDPIGGTPVEFSSMVDQLRSSDGENRQVVDLLFGVTQVIDRSSLFQVNLSLSEANGYMTDPYKFVSVVDDSGEPIDQLYETRPDYRSRQSIYLSYKKMFSNREILTASYRYMTDDWGVDSNTVDLTYRFRLDQGYFWQPHLRWYEQSAADFYRHFCATARRCPNTPAPITGSARCRPTPWASSSGGISTNATAGRCAWSTTCRQGILLHPRRSGS